MKQFCLVLLGFSSLLTIAACHKTVPVAASNTPAPPAASAPPARPESRPSPTPAPVKAAVRTPANNPVRNAATPARLTPQDRATLNDRLTRLSDALFDYDKATIRPDAVPQRDRGLPPVAAPGASSLRLQQHPHPQDCRTR